MIMKKTYLKPEVEMMSIMSINMLAASAPVVDGEGDGDYVNKHRGEWGNVWGK